MFTALAASVSADAATYVFTGDASYSGDNREELAQLFNTPYDTTFRAVLTFDDTQMVDDAMYVNWYSGSAYNYVMAHYLYDTIEWTVGDQTWTHLGAYPSPSELAGSYVAIYDGTSGTSSSADLIQIYADGDQQISNGLTVTASSIECTNYNPDTFDSADAYHLNKLNGICENVYQGYINLKDGQGNAVGKVRLWSVSMERLPDVSAIPEPATWLMMIMGFGLTGLAVRRRRALAA
ncbi:PEPxxWA-CTERM sorting domain-containing protein [Gimibacter soli]|uniref:PEPxxWA-CTERM sorting domain-containing protein n=1 Tax=Gimibacter soli TaxID=3024400 RepID=A0AAF0BMP5_9PROT|nr:PEPxxWA-CTERM sorting domain-containing protein [Gimibacter soli]WCL55802.1 PEPxxWA-CTERM sorting domain-containing protein [Gimibacter soli]